jgi:hypothetical protein
MARFTIDSNREDSREVIANEGVSIGRPETAWAFQAPRTISGCPRTKEVYLISQLSQIDIITSRP